MTNLSYRPATTDDAPSILRIYAPFCAEESTVSFEYEPPSVKEMGDRIETVVKTLPWLVAEKQGAVIAFAYASPYGDRAAYKWSVSLSLYVDAEVRREGLGTELYLRLLEILRRLGYFKAIAGITLPNPGSEAIHAKFGFEPIGIYKGIGFKVGRWLDVGRYQLALKPEETPPAMPLSIGALDASVLAEILS